VAPYSGTLPPPQSNARILEQVPGDGPEHHVDPLATPIAASGAQVQAEVIP